MFNKYYNKLIELIKKYGANCTLAEIANKEE